ncbi:MAG: hypothetical protein KF788_21055 [Piscinibacter sp.]|nr:hypothetical protein [Piscinibacter sp.]
MTHAAPLWRFTSEVCAARQSQLLAWKSFDEIIERFNSCLVAPLYWERAIAPHLTSCFRASFELTVDPDLYDGFFNSPAGYRGQYAQSEAAGEAANRRLVAALLPRLVAAADNHEAVTDGRLTRSLLGAQAKVWIVESEVEEQLGAPSPAIVYPAWEFHAPDGQGLRAPRGSQLEVKGAWLAPDGTEVVNPAKRRRSNFIYETGDSKWKV